MDMDRLYETVCRDEGVKDEPYTDSTGHLTVGVGHNLSNSPIDDEYPLSPERIRELYDADMAIAIKDAQTYCGDDVWNSLSPLRKEVLSNFSFNLGLPTMMKFKGVLRGLQAEDYDEAAAQMQDSLWFRQVGDRAVRLINAMRTDDPAALEL